MYIRQRETDGSRMQGEPKEQWQTTSEAIGYPVRIWNYLEPIVTVFKSHRIEKLGSVEIV